uniref:precorrin-4 C(11)-methyltransferase n=1 Tax=Fodinicola feengrottensis TaxID=435914 RepID=UPI0013D74B0F|nr:precorrin-4 C(11)-methyltransferase [Fodinicola feengrottensis]
MTVHFIGAGPGAADLITVRGQALIAASPVCLYAGSLVPTELLAWCPPGARLVDTADLTLDQIVAEMVSADTSGSDVARLCSGDPSIFSAVAEQARRLDAAGVAYDITPGVAAFSAAAASLGREFTVPGVGQTVILTRTSARATPMPAGEDLATLGQSQATMVVHLAVQRIDQLVAELTPNYGTDCPVAVVAMASRPDEVILRGTLADIAAQVHEAGIKRTAVVIVGQTLTAASFPDSHLYSAARVVLSDGLGPRQCLVIPPGDSRAQKPAAGTVGKPP